MREPLPHQQKVIDLIKDKDRYGLYLSPGLGKTFTTLYDWYYSDKKNLLVVTMASLLATWEKEAKLMDFPIPIKVIKLNKGSRTSFEEMEEQIEKDERCIYIISYQTSWRMPGLLNFPMNDFSLAFDESHKLKNRGSSQAKFSMNLVNRYNRVRLLTGSPRSVSNEDFYWSLKILGEKDFRTKTIKTFKDYFIVEEKKPYTNYSIYIGDKNSETLEEIVKQTSIFMDEKSAGVTLPEQIFKTFYAEPSRDYFKAIKDKVYKSWMIKNSGSKFMAHRQGASGFFYGEDMYGNTVNELLPTQPKQDLLRDLLESIDGKVIVYYNFVQEKEDIAAVAKKIGKTVSFIASGDIDTSGDIVISNFVNGTGLNLQGESNTMIYYSPTIVGVDFIQSKKRIHREGQKHTCYYYSFITQDSIEEKIMSKIQKNETFTTKMFEEEYGKEED